MADARRGHVRSTRSRIVGWLKIALPMIALALLGTVFLWERAEDEGVGLTFSRADVEAMKTGLKLTGPQLSGASMGGDLYDFRAELVTPRDLDLTQADITTLTGRISFRDGQVVTLSSDSARIDMLERRVTLQTGITISTSDGYDASASRLEMDVANAVLTASGPIEATGPPGRITAGGMTIRPAQGAGDNETLIRFTGGVTLRYNPKPEDGQ